MEELGSLWNYDYQENCDELKLKIQYSAIELESVKMEANEQIRKYKEELKLMLNLLNLAYQERDEARDQLQKLLNKFMPYPQPETPVSPLVIAAKTNSSITESNSLSDHTYNNNNNNHHSHGSSPVDSLFDAVTSPDFPTADSSGIGLMNQPFVHEFNNGLVVPSMAINKIDSETTVIDNLAKGKTLPEKGKLLQAVMEAGPLLSTLLVAGPLPQWRNPPPSDTFKIPPVSINGCDSKIGSQKPVGNPSKTVVRKRVNSSKYPDLTRGTHQMCSSAMLNFASSGSGSGMSQSQSQLLSSSKRQRFE